MTDKLFDEFVKGKLGQYDSGAPMNVWERIREKEKDDKKGFFFFKRFLLTGVLLLTLSGIGFLTLTQIKNNGTNNAKLPAGDADRSTAMKQTISEKSSKLNQQNENTSTNKKITSAKEITLPATNEKTTDEFMNKNAQPLLAQKKSAGKNHLPGNSSNTEKNQSFVQTKKPGKIKNQQQDNSRITQLQQQTEQTIQQNQWLQFSNASNKFAANRFIPASIPYNVNHPGCPTVNGPRRNDFYIELYGSPDYTMRSFSNNAVYNSYVSQRRSSEDNRNGFSAGIRIAKNIGEKFLVKGGVNYSQINERLRIINYNEKQLTQIITIRTVIRAPGDTLFIRDTSYFEQTGTRYLTTYNRYRFIDIPVIFSYEFGNPEILSFSVNAGPVFNITSFYKGKVLDTAYSPVPISTSKGNGPNNWRSNIGVGVFASFSVYKPMGSRLQLFAEPYFRYNFKPVTQSSNFVVQRYSVSGMQLGIRYNLKNNRQRYR